MITHLVVNNTNLTPYIVDGTYNVNSEDVYESWKDGNMKEHRVIVAQKISGSFDIACSNRTTGISLDTFLSTWNSAVNNGVATIGLWVPSKGAFEALECYYDIVSKDHILSGDGSFIDVLTVQIKEC